MNVQDELIAELRRRGQEADIPFFVVGAALTPERALPSPLKIQLSNGEWTTFYPGTIESLHWPETTSFFV